MFGCRNSSRKAIGLPGFQNAAEQNVNGHPSFHTKNYMSARFESCHDLYRVDLRGHYGCVNAIEFSNKGGEFVVSGKMKKNVVYTFLF